MKYCFFIFLFALFYAQQGFSQQPTNIDPSKNYINVGTPKTPESAAFEKYGSTEVNEFTGTTDIGIPIYTLKSRFLEVPVTLSYQATGIRVNQEASWVGLGFDLIAGGRITVETRGCADFNSQTRGLTSSNLQIGMTQIFNRLGNHGENAVLTPATYWEPPQPPYYDSNYYNGYAISEMTQYGTGEPDIFRANFLGHSITFYVDKISNTIKFLGEQSTFNINYTLDSYNNITTWTLVDNVGVTFYFNQAETSTNTLPGNAVVPSTVTSAWLLTKIVHPSGDYIQFTYNNYGYAVPAFSMSGSEDAVLSGTTVASDQNQNVAMQSPYYLTRIESTDAAMDFTLDTRTDLYGPGSRKLTQIKVSDKITGYVKKTVTFNYSYFQTTADQGIHNYLNSLSYNLPSPLVTSSYLSSSNTRLRLDSVNLNDNTLQPPYRFYYNLNVPDKYSYSQDHWGYYNAVINQSNGYSFSHLIPFGGFRGVQNYLPPSNYGFNTSTIGSSRDCDPGWMQAMILDSIVYPTGGSTGFSYEAHQSTMVPTIPITGGGLRVKSIRNYLSGNLIGSKEYAYQNGKYMGTINYGTDANVLTSCVTTAPRENIHFKYTSDGAINFNDILIGYGQVTITEKDALGNPNGSLVRTFNINTTSSNYSNSLGYDLQPPYFAPNESTTDPTGSTTYDRWLDPTHKNFPPTPSSNLEGKLMQEQYFDNSTNLLKSINFYYHLANYTNNYYDVKAIQNRDGGFNISCPLGYSINTGLNDGGLRPVNLFVSPAKLFHILKDSVIELTYSGNNFITKKIVYQYNSYYQPMFETIYNSDGTQTINYTRTSAEIYVPNGGGASRLIATQMYQMLGQHVLDLPIEQIVIHRGTGG